MLARSTACAPGASAATSTKATSISSMRPSRTSRLAGLTSRWARPASHSLRMMPEAVVDHRLVDLGLAQLHRAVEELGDQQVLAVGGQLDEPVGPRAWAARPGGACAGRSPPAGPAGGRCGTASRPPAGRTAAPGPACTSGPSAGGCGRTACRTGPCRGSPLTLIRSGVEPADPASPNGLTSSISRPSWSARARRMACPRAPPTSRWAVAAPPVADREDLVGGEPAEGQQRDGHPDGRPDQHVAGGVDAQVHAGDREQG